MMTTCMTHVTCGVTYQNGPPQTAAPRRLSGHVAVQQEVGLEFRKQQQDVGERADERERQEREAGAAETAGHTHLCVHTAPSDTHSDVNVIIFSYLKLKLTNHSSRQSDVTAVSA